MDQSYIILATPRVMRLLEVQFAVFEAVAARINRFLQQGLPQAALAQGLCHFSIQEKPPLSVVYLAGQDPSSHFLILSGAGDGFGPTRFDIPSRAKGVFPTIDNIHSGQWEPLERIHLT